MSESVRVRIAPSPTGFAHLGTASTALYNVLFARQHDGTFVLRIDDTDVERNRPEYELLIDESLRWLGLDWDEGPIRQSERLDIYKEEAAKLLASGKAYRCYCTPEELEAERKQAQLEKRAYRYSRRCLTNPPPGRTEFAVRFQVPGGEVTFHDMVRGEMRFDSNLIGDFIIVKSDGYPTYQFASPVDDALMKIS
ncbi:MAG TPA: glutamate--tRNA ligase family protein, partial [Candidatus Dormibacteraeota bacterium]|nr:glutamate--tRNA ligase family protein [Candidatus Dormibacteraeota bacterium]